jgi:hypothetical protein
LFDRHQEKERQKKEPLFPVVKTKKKTNEGEKKPRPLISPHQLYKKKKKKKNPKMGKKERKRRE